MGNIELTPKQEKYCQMFVKYGSRSTAYRKSYETDGMKQTTIWTKASILHRKPEIQARVRELQEDLSKRNALTLDRAIQALSEIATFDILDLYDHNGNLKPLDEIPKPARLSIQDIRVSEGKITGIKILNKLDALEKLLKYFGAYQADTKQQKEVEPLKIVIISPNETKDIKG